MKPQEKEKFKRDKKSYKKNSRKNTAQKSSLESTAHKTYREKINGNIMDWVQAMGPDELFPKSVDPPKRLVYKKEPQFDGSYQIKVKPVSNSGKKSVGLPKIQRILPAWLRF